ESPARREERVRRRLRPEPLGADRVAVDPLADQAVQAGALEDRGGVLAHGHDRAAEPRLARVLEVPARAVERGHPVVLEPPAGPRPGPVPGGAAGPPSGSRIPRLARKARTPSSRGRPWMWP